MEGGRGGMMAPLNLDPSNGLRDQERHARESPKPEMLRASRSYPCVFSLGELRPIA
jgi:hypothetical protein